MFVTRKSCCFLYQSICCHSRLYVSIIASNNIDLVIINLVRYIILTIYDIKITQFILMFILYFRKDSVKLGEKYKKGIPIEVVPMAYVPVKRKIEDTYRGTAKIRMAIAKAVNIFSLSKFSKLLLQIKSNMNNIQIIYVICAGPSNNR